MSTKLYVALFVVAALVGACLFADHAFEWRAERDRAETALVGAANTIRKMKTAELISQGLQVNYENELSTLRTGRDVPAPVVRLCLAAAPTASPVRAIPAPASGSHDTLAGTGGDGGGHAQDPVPGTDIGPALIQYARDADELVARCRLSQAGGDAVEKTLQRAAVP